MPFHIVSGDITKLQVDAIVNAANSSLLGGGGVDGAIHRAAGPRLLEECRGLHGCRTGEAKVTLGYDLPAKYVIHTVGPVWQGGGHGEEELLRSAYRNSLLLALEKHCESVAFPMISAGVYGYPKEQALQVAVSTIRAFLEENDMDVTLVIFDKSSFRIDRELFSDLSGFVDRMYDGGSGHPMGGVMYCAGAAPMQAEAARSMPMQGTLEEAKSGRMGMAADVPQEAPKKERRGFLHRAKKESAARMAAEMEVCEDSIAPHDLEAELRNLDESFSRALLRMIDVRGMKDSECYKKANIDRKLFSKIRSDVNYRPSKQTVLAFAVALELDLSETQAFLQKAGFALSRSSKADVIVEYFISHGNYDMYSINQVLFAYDQNLLGA